MVDPAPHEGSQEWFALVLEAIPGEMRGLSDEQVREVASVNQGELHPSYINLLRAAGAGPSSLFRGSSMLYPALLTAIPACREIARASEPPFRIPAGSTLMGHHQGYQFLYLTDDGVFLFLENEKAPTKVAESLSQCIQEEVLRITDSVQRSIGHYRRQIVSVFESLTRKSEELGVSPPDHLVSAVAAVAAGDSTALSAIIEIRTPEPPGLVRSYDRLRAAGSRLQKSLDNAT